MKYNRDKHYRRSIRLKGYDYRKEGAYFVTICVQDRECLFGEMVDGKMNLNETGKIVHMYWNYLWQKYADIELDEFVIMPNF